MVVAGLIALGFVVTIATVQADLRVVVVPLFAQVAIAAMFVARLNESSARAPIDDIGLWYAAAATLYGILPLIVYLAIGGQYTLFNDNRLFSLQPPPATVARVAFMYVVHLAAFTAAYSLVRRSAASPSDAGPTRFPQSMVIVAGAIGIGFTLLNTDFSAAGDAASYASGYARLNALPLVVRQILRFVAGIATISVIVFLGGLFSRYAKYRWAIVLWLAFNTLATVITLGSRQGLVIAVATCVLFYHTMVKPIRFRTAFIAGILGVSAFLGLGAYRTYRGLVTRGLTVQVGAGEFESLFGTAVDLDARRTRGDLENVPPGAYVADIVSPIPSQLLPFQKVDLADWYVTQFYPAAKALGQGYAFGVIAQSIIGAGWADLVMRGLLLGYLYGVMYRYYRRHGSRPWVIVAYFFAVLYSYQAFRASSFALLNDFVQHFVPAVIVIEVARAVLARVSQKSLRAQQESRLLEST